MTYLSRGKRDIVRQQYLTELARWAKHFNILAPEVKVHARNSATYRWQVGRLGTIILPPGCARPTLVHEFAHHYARETTGHHGHGVPFRVALVEVAAVVLGRASRYPWATEYDTVQAWARRHGLLGPKT